MKKLIPCFLVLFFIGCNHADDGMQAEGAHDAAGMFLNYVLDGNFDAAHKLMVQDRENHEWLKETEERYVNIPKDDQRTMRESDPTIYETRKISDSVSIIFYSNSYNNRKDSLKLVRRNNKWLVDLKYTFTVPNNNNAQ